MTSDDNEHSLVHIVMRGLLGFASAVGHQGRDTDP